MKKYFDYLDNLRESGVTNMFGAVPYLQQEFPELSYDRAQAVYVLREWMADHSGNGGGSNAQWDSQPAGEGNKSGHCK